MSAWKWLTQKLPLEDDRDIMARIGFRFIWCTGPYFLVAVVMSRYPDKPIYFCRNTGDFEFDTFTERL